MKHTQQTKGNKEKLLLICTNNKINVKYTRQLLLTDKTQGERRLQNTQLV